MSVSDGGRVRRQRIREFTVRDGEALSWLGEMYGARLDVLAVLLGRLSTETNKRPLSVSGVRKQVERWQRSGLVRVERALGQSWVTLTRSGYDRVGQSYGTWAVPVTRVRHVHCVNVVRLWYEGLTYQGASMAARFPWISERTLFVERGREANWHIPDGLVEDPASPQAGPVRYLGVEVELTHKARRAYDEEVLAKLGPGVESLQYFVPTEEFAQRLRGDLQTVSEQRGHTKTYRVRLLPEVPGVSYQGMGW